MAMLILGRQAVAASLGDNDIAGRQLKIAMGEDRGERGYRGQRKYGNDEENTQGAIVFLGIMLGLVLILGAIFYCIRKKWHRVCFKKGQVDQLSILAGDIHPEKKPEVSPYQQPIEKETATLGGKAAAETQSEGMFTADMMKMIN